MSVGQQLITCSRRIGFLHAPVPVGNTSRPVRPMFANGTGRRPHGVNGTSQQEPSRGPDRLISEQLVTVDTLHKTS